MGDIIDLEFLEGHLFSSGKACNLEAHLAPLLGITASLLQWRHQHQAVCAWSSQALVALPMARHSSSPKRFEGSKGEPRMVVHLEGSFRVNYNSTVAQSPQLHMGGLVCDPQSVSWAHLSKGTWRAPQIPVLTGVAKSCQMVLIFAKHVGSSTFGRAPHIGS